VTRTTRQNSRSLQRRSFTLVELLIVATILVILASTALFALYGTMEHARERRTTAQIAKLNQLIMDQWDGYRTRKVPILLPPNASFDERGLIRLLAIREIMRMEMPDRITDLTWSQSPIPVPSLNNTVSIGAPSLWKRHRRRAGFGNTVPTPGASSATEAPLSTSLVWSSRFQGAECLYLIVSSIRTEDKSAIDFFRASEIGDMDGDTMFEILDGWGRPIDFIRWAPGFGPLPGPDAAWGAFDVDDDDNGVVDDSLEAGSKYTDDRSEIQIRPHQDPVSPGTWLNPAPDPFDPLRADFRWNPRGSNPDTDPSNDPFAL
jgi:prepilin-type N-terminal cleavage/methylation domain-containing protein